MLNSSWFFNCLSRIQHILPLSSKHRQLLWKAAVGALRPLWRCADVPAPNPQGLHLQEAKRNDVSQRIDKNRIQMSSTVTSTVINNYVELHLTKSNYTFKNRCSHMYSSRVDFLHMFKAIQNLAEISTQHRSNAEFKLILQLSQQDSTHSATFIQASAAALESCCWSSSTSLALRWRSCSESSRLASAGSQTKWCQPENWQKPHSNEQYCN